MRNFGLTVEDYARMLESQDGVCAICRRPERIVDPRFGTPRKLAVDHDHRTNEIRGLLCAACNRAIGCLEEDEGRLFTAIRYLRDMASRPKDEVRKLPASGIRMIVNRRDWEARRKKERAG